jgi:hypothetical protein
MSKIFYNYFEPFEKEINVINWNCKMATTIGLGLQLFHCDYKNQTAHIGAVQCKHHHLKFYKLLLLSLFCHLVKQSSSCVCHHIDSTKPVTFVSIVRTCKDIQNPVFYIKIDESNVRIICNPRLLELH